MAQLAAVAALSSLAHAEADPYWFGVSQSFTRDTNVFRNESGSAQSADVISSTGLLAGVDQPIGRGLFTASLSANVNRYRNNTQLDNTDHNLRLGLDWASVERLSGDVRLYDRRSLYNQPSREAITVRDELTNRGGSAQVRMGVVTRWTLEGGVAFDEAMHSNERFNNRDLRQAAGNLGVRFQPSDLFSSGIGVRHSEGKYPRYVDLGSGLVTGDDFKRDDIDLIAVWAPTGASSLNARLSATREQHSSQAERSANTWTGALGYDWKPTGKTSFKLVVTRDTNAGSSDINYGLVSDSSNDTRRYTSIQGSVRWEATSKIAVYSSLAYSRRTLDDAFVLTYKGQPPSPQIASGRDRTINASLGATYQLSRGIQFSCSVARETRKTAGDTSGVSYPYGVTTSTCNGQLVLR